MVAGRKHETPESQICITRSETSIMSVLPSNPLGEQRGGPKRVLCITAEEPGALKPLVFKGLGGWAASKPATSALEGNIVSIPLVAKKSVLGPGEGRLSIPRLSVIQILKKWSGTNAHEVGTNPWRIACQGSPTDCSPAALSPEVPPAPPPQCLAGHSLRLDCVFCRLCLDCSLPPPGFYSEVTSSGRPFHTAPQSLEPHDPILSHISLAPLSCIINTQLNDGIFVCTTPPTHTHIGLPLWFSRLQCRKPRFESSVGQILWRRRWQPTPVFLPRESHGQRSLAGYSPWGRKSRTRLSD